MTDIPFNNIIKVNPEKIQATVNQIPSGNATNQELKNILSLIDLTSLEGKDNAGTIKALCEKAIANKTAAVCVYPSMVRTAKQALSDSNIKVAAVAGAFPSGQLPLNLRLAEAQYAINEGADEIDMVISRGKFLEGNYSFLFEEVASFKELCKNTTLKVILETGELNTLQNIRTASDIALHAGADFIKTSTGKISTNATLEAVCVMLMAIKDFYSTSGKKCGIKPSGGISEGETAIKYLKLTETILGNDWLNASLFRFGASRLVDTIAAQLSGQKIKNGSGY
jgi:deoxyribose-phosphate aldolase